MSDNDKTEDFKEWGDQWVYCNQHCTVHKTGWCTVDISEKVALGYNLTREAAYNKVLRLNLFLNHTPMD